MASTAIFERFHTDGREVRESWRLDRMVATRWLVPVGRVFFALLFVISGFGHFSRETIAYAAAQGVPAPELLVPFSGLLALAGGLMVAFGWHARVGGVLLALFLLPVTAMMHDFWNLADPAARMLQRTMFLKNLSMLGGALLVAYLGSGPLSLDARAPRVLPRAPKA
jgi:putative oxidoreductase